MIRIIVLAVAVLILVAGIAVSESGGVVAQDESPAPTVTPTPGIIEPEPTETPVPKDPDAEEGESAWEGPWWRIPIPKWTPTPRPTATPTPTVTPESPEIVPTPRPRLTAPPAPTGLETKQGTYLAPNGKNSLIVTWDEMEGVDHFRLRVSSNRGRTGKVHDDDLTGTIQDFRDLKCGTTYYMTLEAYGDGKKYKEQYGSRSAEIRAKTTQCPSSFPKPTRTRYDCPKAVPSLPRDKHEPTKLTRSTDGEIYVSRSVIYHSVDTSLLTLFNRALGAIPDDVLVRCAFAVAATASDRLSTTTIKAALYTGSRTSLGRVPPGGTYSNRDLGKECEESFKCLWESDSLMSYSNSNEVIHTKATHKIERGKSKWTVTTKGGFESKTGLYVKTP